LATGAARFIFLTPVFRADAVFLVTAVVREDAVFFRVDAFFVLADLRTDTAFLPAERVRPVLRRVVAAFRRAVFRTAAFRLAMSSSFLRLNQVPAYLDSGPISDVKSIAYRRRTILCMGSGCDPWPPSYRLSEDGAVPPCILHRRYSRGGPVPATETGRARREPCKHGHSAGMR
jgi:hypothetical protein